MMEGEIHEALRDVLVEELQVERERITPEANLFDDLGLDSLDLVTALMAIEERFGIKVSDEDLKDVRTIDEAVDVLAGKAAVHG